jgi:hypothetical protein
MAAKNAKSRKGVESRKSRSTVEIAGRTGLTILQSMSGNLSAAVPKFWVRLGIRSIQIASEGVHWLREKRFSSHSQLNLILSAPVELRLLQQTLHNRKLRRRCDPSWFIVQDSR